MKRSAEACLDVLRSSKAFYVILGLFIFEALWVALSSRYPMAFDEQFHFGVIQLHTTNWLPSLRHVKGDTSQYGAIARDPSFLYHYLMSFPYRLIRLFTDNQPAQIIILRIINIGLASGGLIVSRKLLRRLGLSTLRTNVVLLFFIFLPIMPLLAGQVTYDNLLFLLAAVTMLLSVIFIQRYQADGTIDAGLLSWLLIICLYASMVKYAFLPVFVAIVLCLAVIVLRHRGRTIQAYRSWWRSMRLYVKVGLLASIVAGLGLFASSYGVNIVRYHAIAPRCDKVLSIKQCSSYAPWYRDYVNDQHNGRAPLTRVPVYAAGWINQMMRETFFEITSHFQNGQVVYYTYSPLLIIYVTAWFLLVVGGLALLYNIRSLWRNPSHRLVLLVLLIYGAALFATDLSSYLRTDVPVAIHGRYLIPIILPVIALALLSVPKLAMAVYRKRPRLSRDRLRSMQVGGLVLVLLLWLQGGGLVAFIISSNDSWMWQQSPAAIHVNRDARSVLWHEVFKRADNH